MKELAGVTSTKEYADFQRIRDHAPALLDALIEARFYVKMALDNCYNPVAEKKLEKIDDAIAEARGE